MVKNKVIKVRFVISAEDWAEAKIYYSAFEIRDIMRNGGFLAFDLALEARRKAWMTSEAGLGVREY